MLSINILSIFCPHQHAQTPYSYAVYLISPSVPTLKLVKATCAGLVTINNWLFKVEYQHSLNIFPTSTFSPLRSHAGAVSGDNWSAFLWCGSTFSPLLNFQKLLLKIIWAKCGFADKMLISVWDNWSENADLLTVCGFYLENKLRNCGGGLYVGILLGICGLNVDF